MLLAILMMPAAALTETTDYVIFSAELALAQVGKDPTRTIGIGKLPYFEPSQSSVDLFKSALSDYLQANQDVVLLDLSDYRFQFIGLSVRGKDAVFANAFCRYHWSDDSSWRETLVVVDDGGNCYFQATYDTDSHTIIWLMINGVA